MTRSVVASRLAVDRWLRRRRDLTECPTLDAGDADQRFHDRALCRMMELLSSPEAWLGLSTLTALEIVHGVDNIIFIAILSGRLPASQRERARKLGLAGCVLVAARPARHDVVRSSFSVERCSRSRATASRGGFSAHIRKGYIYGAMGFSVFVELINIRTTLRSRPVELNKPGSLCGRHPRVAPAVLRHRTGSIA